MPSTATPAGARTRTRTRTARRLYDSSGRWVCLDARHRIGREGTGDLSKPWVFRFCDEFVSSHPTKRAAEDAALSWEMERAARLTRGLE